MNKITKRKLLIAITILTSTTVTLPYSNLESAKKNIYYPLVNVIKSNPLKSTLFTTLLTVNYYKLKRTIAKNKLANAMRIIAWTYKDLQDDNRASKDLNLEKRDFIYSNLNEALMDFPNFDNNINEAIKKAKDLISEISSKNDYESLMKLLEEIDGILWRTFKDLPSGPFMFNFW